jgi:hypothetical protein
MYLKLSDYKEDLDIFLEYLEISYKRIYEYDYNGNKRTITDIRLTHINDFIDTIDISIFRNNDSYEYNTTIAYIYKGVDPSIKILENGPDLDRWKKFCDLLNEVRIKRYVSIKKI